MAWLGDTNILLRFRTPTAPQHTLIRDALDALKKRGETVYIAPQNWLSFGTRQRARSNETALD